MARIQLIEGDLTTAQVDAIVNAANSQMLGGGGVDGAIHRAAGPELLEQCKNIKAVNGVRCPAGEARITGAGKLCAKYVIHTVGPIYHREKNPEFLLRSAYSNSLQLALSYNCHSVAFPAISCGAYGYPLEEAAQIAVETCSTDTHNELAIYFYLYGSQIFQVWQSALINYERK